MIRIGPTAWWFRASAAWHKLRAKESYHRIHESIQTAFARCGESVELAPRALKFLPGQCFAGYEESDLLWRGRKVAGAAQRRTRDGLLIQGSVQPPRKSASRLVWQAAMRNGSSRPSLSMGGLGA